MTPETVVGLITALGIIYIAWRDRNSAGDTLVQDAMQMLDRHDREIKELKNELRWYRYGVAILIAQIRRLGVTPEWTPDMPRDDE